MSETHGARRVVCLWHTKDRQMSKMEMTDEEMRAAREARIREKYLLIGRKIAYYRRLKGYTQGQLAKRIGISANYLSQIECGKREQYPLYTLMMIADALGIELKVLCE